VASREELLAGIRPGMRLTKGFIRSIYSNEISCPGFAEQAIAALEQAGCSRARQYYNDWVTEYEAAYKAEIRPVAHWYRLECEKRWKKKQEEGEEKRKQKETEHLQQMSNKGLIVLLENLTGAN
jgi:hypothetical protein